MRFFHEKSLWWWNQALQFRSLGWYGVKEGDKMAWVWGAARDLRDQNWRDRLKAKIQRQKFLNAFSMTESKMKSFAHMLVKWQPKFIRAYSSALALFAQFLKDNQITGIRPKLIETSAEKLMTPQRQLFEDVFQCKVADCYGAREMATIAYECPDGGLHVNETHIVEILTDGETALPGQLGEVVITSLIQKGMPFIRYKIGDMAISDPGRCPCGRGLPLLKEISGRIDDFLVTVDGQFVSGGIFSFFLGQRPEIARYRVYQPDRRNLEVRLQCRQKINPGFIDSIRNEIKKRFGDTMHIDVKLVDSFELTPDGKHRLVVSDVKPDLSR
jgi:phenylacetate-CoA ligase